MMKRTILFLALSTILFSGCSPDKPTLAKQTVPLMGTFVEVRIWGDPEETAVVIRETLKYAAEMGEKFNIYSTASEINKLNLKKQASVSPDLYKVLELAKKISVETGGEFDVTVAPLLKDSGFYEDMPVSIRDMIPDKYEKDGWKNVILTPPDHVSLKNNVWIDTSGIAKGYIVDRMADLLEEKGVKDFLINAGGDIYCGDKCGNGDWMVGLRGPASKSALLVLSLKNRAVATSGDYENCAVDIVTAEELSHIVDPAGPYVMKKNFSSMTVIGSDCAVSDALATAMMAMGAEKAIALANTMEGVEVISVTSPDGKCVVDYSDGAEEYVAMVGCSVSREGAGQ